jgi:hypothetical protein
VVKNKIRGIRDRWFLSLLGFLILLVTGSAQAEEIDRLLAAVNGKVITDGDLRLARNLNAVSALGKRGMTRTFNEELNRLVELELLRQELENFAAAPPEESRVVARMDELRNAYAEIGGLDTLLARIGLQEAELRAYVTLQTAVDRFVDYRFRPFIVISPEQKQIFYQQRLLPQLKRSPGAQIPTLEEVSGKIEEILTEEKVNEELNRWLVEIRRYSRVEFFREETPAGGSTH